MSIPTVGDVLANAKQAAQNQAKAVQAAKQVAAEVASEPSGEAPK